jgi:hypothetical protein
MVVFASHKIFWLELEAGCLSFVQKKREPGHFSFTYAPFLLSPTEMIKSATRKRRRSAHPAPHDDDHEAVC